MLCEDCHKNQATVIITVTTGGETTTRHLCPECMKKMESSFAQGDVQGFLSSLLSMLSAQPEAQEAPALKCSGCGLTYEEFQRTGKLGCAQCYHDFAEQLRPLLLRIHGRSQHAGRTPHGGTQSAEQPGESEQRLNELHARMDQAVAAENFEEAARLRDEIRALTEKPSVEERS